MHSRLPVLDLGPWTLDLNLPPDACAVRSADRRRAVRRRVVRDAGRRVDLRLPPPLPAVARRAAVPLLGLAFIAAGVLAKCANAARNELSSAQKDSIALAMKDMALVSARCPRGFAPFAAEVEERIKPLFRSVNDAEEGS